MLDAHKLIIIIIISLCVYSLRMEYSFERVGRCERFYCKGAVTSERKRCRLECIATGLCCLFTLEGNMSESESDVASLPSCIGLQPIFGTIRSMLYQVSAACLPCCAIFK